MNNYKIFRSDFVLLILILLLVVFTYWDLSATFFQQDEWQTLAAHIYFQSKGPVGFIESFLPTDSLSHFSPLAGIFSWINYLFFKNNFTLYAWQSIILHILNTCLLYYFVYTWLKNKTVAVFSTLIFAINSIPSQAVTWVAAANSYEAPMLFILLSLIFFHRFLLINKNQVKNLILSLVMLFISLMFHETGVFLLLFYAIVFLLLAKPRIKRLVKPLSIGILLIIAMFILIRVPFLFGFSSTIPTATDISHPSVFVYPYRMISLSIKSFAASLFPQTFLIQVSDQVVRLSYPQFIASDNVPNPYISQSIVLDLVSYILSVLIIFISILFIQFTKDKKTHKLFWWALLYIPLSVIPYAFVPGRAGYASIFEPKFLYITSIGVAIFLAVIFYRLLIWSKLSKLKTVLIVLFFGLYILFHIFQIRERIGELEQMGSQIKTFISTIQTSYPRLPKNVVFFTSSNMAYYGMPPEETILPVQVGFGKILMIWYQTDERFPRCLYENNFLINLLAQGYQQCEGRGFGYFRDYNKLKMSVKKNNIPLNNIISFSWNGNTDTFKDISKEVKLKLQKDEK